MTRAGLVLAVAGLVGCSSSRSPGYSEIPQLAGVDAAVPIRAEVDASAESSAEDASRSRDADAEAEAAKIFAVLFPDRAGLASGSCAAGVAPDIRIRCFFDERYRGDAEAANLAYELFAKWHVVAGVETAHTMDGGYRGTIRLEPAVPVFTERKHLEWLVAAFRDIGKVFASMPARDGGAPKRYRWQPLTLRFVRSVGARTPSAYAADWTIGWNLAGSLHTSADAVRETLVHEIFHLNDEAHAPTSEGTWSQQSALSSTFDVIVKKCRTATACLAPYSPNDTIVRGGTYYSFQPGNGVREYAAELALRYFREQRAMQRGSGVAKPFKCGPEENARAWVLMRDEFWDGVDLVPPCTRVSR